jgi:hypothetical protein
MKKMFVFVVLLAQSYIALAQSVSSGGGVTVVDPAFPIRKAQSRGTFTAFQTQANGVAANGFRSIIVNGSVLPSTEANFLATATPDLVTFSGWGLRGNQPGNVGTNPLVVSNFGAWFENNRNAVWTQEIDTNNEGATQPEGSDSGGVGLALNTGSTYSPDTAISIRRMDGAGTGPGWLRGINIEGVRNSGIRIMAMSPSQMRVTPAAPGTITALEIGVGGDSQYRFTQSQNGQMDWGSGNAPADVSLGRTAKGTLAVGGTLTASSLYAPTLQVTASATFQGPVVLASYTVATLPACTGSTNRNALAVVTDANAPTYNGRVSGGGRTTVPVFCNGTEWTAH